MRKRGISPIIATVLIIAITISAGIILYGMIQPLIRANIGQATCTQVTFELDRFASCREDSKIWVSIDRTMSTSDEPTVTSWKIVVSSGEGEKMTFDGKWDNIVPGVQLTPELSVSDFGKTVTNVHVYPVIKSENIIEECTNIQRQIKLSPCAP